MTSYFRAHYDPDLNLSDTYLVFPLTITTCAIFMQLGAVLMDRMHPRLHMAIGGLTFAFAVFACSFTKNLWVFIFFYSFVLGFGFGLLYMLPIRNAWLFYPQKKGMVSGTILCAKSMGSILSSLFATYLVNPNNLKADLTVYNGKEK